MKPRTIRRWSLVHKWTSLISTPFLLLLCLTGLPLIFHHEIDELLGYAPQAEQHASGAQRATLDTIAGAALAAHPGQVLQYISWDTAEPNLVTAFTNATVNGDPNNAVLTAFDAYTAKPVGAVGGGPMFVILKLHVDMFAGQPGKLFLGAMGFLFIVAIVSGIVLYWPFTKRARFGDIRASAASARVKWFDWHNLAGVITVIWAIVVGATGVINTWAEPMLDVWKNTELAAMVAAHSGEAAPSTEYASLDRVLEAGQQAVPRTTPAFIAFPGTPFSSSHHFAVFLRGDRPLTARLLTPALIDARTAIVTDARGLPIYLKALFISQPLHFGDYGGMPMKIIWCALDLMVILVLGTGLYLWLKKIQRKQRGKMSKEKIQAVESATT